MEFGKTPFFKEVTYSLAPDHVYFTEQGQEQEGAIHLGTPGWNQKEWIKRIYPDKTNPRDFLYHYSRRFNGIELNTTHYAIPSKERIAQWRQMTPDGFLFSPKIYQAVSHHGLHKRKAEWNDFLTAMMGLEDKLGLSFLQLPETFTIENLPLLKAFLNSKPQDFPLAIELRHKSFYHNQNYLQPVSELLAHHNIATVITDTAGRRDLVHSTLTATEVMVRFIGNQHLQTDRKRLEDWIFKVRSWFEQGLTKLYFFTHQPNNIHSIDLGHYLAGQLNQQFLLNLTEPLAIEQELKQGPQMSLF